MLIVKELSSMLMKFDHLKLFYINCCTHVCLEALAEEILAQGEANDRREQDCTT